MKLINNKRDLNYSYWHYPNKMIVMFKYPVEHFPNIITEVIPFEEQDKYVWVE